jgi:hypothetical protein
MRCVYTVLLIIFTSLPLSFGCALKKEGHAHLHHNSDVGWITITGTVIPTSTIAVDSHGKRLVDVIIESRALELAKENEASVNLHEPGTAYTSELTKSDQAKLKAITELDADERDLGDTYRALSEEAIRIQKTMPNLSTGDELDKGFPDYAFDPETSTPNDRLQLFIQIHQIDDPNLFQFAIAAYDSLSESKATEKQLLESRNVLTKLAQDGKLNLKPEQKARAWSYQQASSIATRTEKRKQTEAEPSLEQEDYNSPFAAKSQSSNAAFRNSLSSGIFVTIHHENDPLIIVPLDQVTVSPLGSLWLTAGDVVELVKANEIAFFQGQIGEKQIGLTGHVQEQGILKTRSQKLTSLFPEISLSPDRRSNLIVVTYPIGRSTAKLLLPFDSGNEKTYPTFNQMQSTYQQIGLIEGTVVTFDSTETNPFILRSRQRIQDSAKAKLSNRPLHDLVENSLIEKTEREGSILSRRSIAIPPAFETACKMTENSINNGTAAIRNLLQVN